MVQSFLVQNAGRNFLLFLFLLGGSSSEQHPFPRLGNCWGADPYISSRNWRYVGFPNITNSTWGDYQVLYLNPFDGCCFRQELKDWEQLIKALKAANPSAVVLATFHLTEIWQEDVKGIGRWLPEDCLMRNSDGSLFPYTCSGVCGSTLMMYPKCLEAAVKNALDVLPELISAGVDGVFLDGVAQFNSGCSHADINCTTPHCKPTPQPPVDVLERRWEDLYSKWFSLLLAKHPGLVWVNNLLDSIENSFIPRSNGRMFEGTDGMGLDNVYDGRHSISSMVSEVRRWTSGSRQPSYVNLHMNSDISGNWRLGRWQNLVTSGEMMRALTDFRRMRFGLGVTLLTDGYFSNDVGTGWYGAPSFYTEYEASLGKAHSGPVLHFSNGEGEEVWSRQFEHGVMVVSSLSSSNFTLPLNRTMRELSPSKNPSRLTDQREAPAWQFVIDNDQGDAPYGPKGGSDWWSGPSRKARFRTKAGNWTVVTDDSQSHQVGPSFLVGFTVPGPLPQGFPPEFSCSWTFVSPAQGPFNFAVTAVNSHLYPLSDAAVICIREVDVNVGESPCLVETTVDQTSGPRDGRWQRAASGVALEANRSYEVKLHLIPSLLHSHTQFEMKWDPMTGGYVAADSLLVESERLYNTGILVRSAVVSPLDSRIFVEAA